MHRLEQQTKALQIARGDQYTIDKPDSFALTKTWTSILVT